MSKKQKAIIYVRTASGAQHQPNQYPLKVQEQKCRRYCKQQSLEVVTTFKEVALSKLSKQPELLKAIAYCQENNVDFIVSDGFNRYARKLTDYTMIKEICGDEVRLQTTAKPIDDIADHNLLEAMNFSLATFEYDIHRQKSMRGQQCMCQSR